ncbi:MAG: hypothetical protein NTX57_20215 [Armatimonadetes bacterium]|nr:hypothetical protein [Armatimonadota bacterium]
MLPYLAALLGGTLTFRLLAPRWPWLVCLAAGNVAGSAALGLVCLALANFLGLRVGVIATASLLFLVLPLVLYRRRPAPQRRPHRLPLTVESVLLLIVALLLTWYFQALFHEQADGYYIGAKDAWADLPYHLAILQGFAYGENFPPSDPLLYDARLAYPYLVDFIAALGVRSGFSLTMALLVQNVSLALSLIALLHRFTQKATRSRLTACLAPLFLFCGGGLGFALFLHDHGSLTRLTDDFTEHTTLLHWGNPLVYWFSSMRGMLLGAPLLVLVWILCWEALHGAPSHAPRRLTLAGVVCGLLPLAHAHTFMTMLALAPLLLLWQPKIRVHTWRFFVPALALALPQLAYATAGSQVHPTHFFGWSLGWMKGEFGVVEYWLWNTGAFLPLLAIGLIAPLPGLVPPRLKRFWAPFALCFLVPNVIKLAPWEWDSIKVLAVWYIASCPIVALVVARLASSGMLGRLIAVGMSLLLCSSGALDIVRVGSRQVQSRIYDPDQLAFATLISETTKPTAVILSAPVHNPPHQLAGRRTFLGYTGFLWTHGLEYGEREKELRTIYAGGTAAEALLKRHRIDAIVVGPMERENLRYHQSPLNEPWLAQFPHESTINADNPERNHTLYFVSRNSLPAR